MARIFLTLFFFIAAIGGSIFYVWPESQKYLSARRDTQALTRISRDLDDAQSVRDDLADKIDSVSPGDLQKVEAALPQGAQDGLFVRTVEYFGAKNGVAIESITLSRGEGNANVDSSTPRPGGVSDGSSLQSLKELSFTLSVSGNYTNLKRFLDDLERGIRIMDIESISFIEVESSVLPVPLTLSGRTYYQ